MSVCVCVVNKEGSMERTRWIECRISSICHEYFKLIILVEKKVRSWSYCIVIHDFPGDRVSP